MFTRSHSHSSRRMVSALMCYKHIYCGCVLIVILLPLWFVIHYYFILEMTLKFTSFAEHTFPFRFDLIVLNIDVSSFRIQCNCSPFISNNDCCKWHCIFFILSQSLVTFICESNIRTNETKRKVKERNNNKQAVKRCCRKAVHSI